MSASPILIYVKKAAKSFRRHPKLTTLYSYIKYFPSWKAHLADGRNSVKDQMPWISFEAIDFIKARVRKEMTIFEYGSGGSTLFWASKVKQVVSVEHDPGWFEKMNEELSHKQIKNVKFILVEAVNDLDPTSKRIENPEDYASADKQYENMNFREYVQTIDNFADHFFDFIVVDGRARPSCIAHALRKLKPGGYLIVDNSEREYYLASFHFDTSKWKRWDFEGPVPYIKHFSQTTVIQKKNI